jgi:hypothetical protein
LFFSISDLEGVAVQELVEVRGLSLTLPCITTKTQPLTRHFPQLFTLKDNYIKFDLCLKVM